MMTSNLIPRGMLSFPNFSLPDFWNEESDWVTSPLTQGSLTVSEDEQMVYVEAAMPGINPSNIETTFQDGYLWIRGEVKEEEDNKKKKYYRKATQSFSYRVAVPGDIDTNREPEASYKHGMIKVAFPKSPKVQPKKIQLKVSE